METKYNQNINKKNFKMNDENNLNTSNGTLP